jgi:hypothetical protein
MKISTNLPRALRIFFNVSRAMVAIAAVMVALVTCLGLVLRAKTSSNLLLLPGLGELVLAPDLKTLGLGVTLDGASTPDLVVQGIRGEVTMNLLTRDPGFRTVALTTIIPAFLIGLTLVWLILGRLRDLCANVERGEIFSEKNLLLVRGLGVLLVISSLSEGAVQVWGRFMLGDYLRTHASLTGVASLPRLSYTWPVNYPGDFTQGLVTGLLVLALSEAFRQGLALKAENDLTV